jgi:hypothetical protein
MDKSKRVRCAKHLTSFEEKGNAYCILVGKPEGKWPVGRPKNSGKYNIKMDLKEIG